MESAAVYQRTTLIAKRKGTGLSKDIKIVKLLGKGSNNRVFLARGSGDAQCIVREPRRASDTQRIGNATWEFRNTVITSGLGVSPALYDAWYTRHATKHQRSGLHLVCDCYDDDLHNLLCESPERVIQCAPEIRLQVSAHLRKMAGAGMLSYDLKPSNMVYRLEPLEVRFIDFGRDFCEWRPYSEDNDFLERAPVCSYVQTLVLELARNDSTVIGEALYERLLYLTMVVILSANLAFTIEKSCSGPACSGVQKHTLNVMAGVAGELHQCTRGREVRMLKKILRHRDIRGTLRHYMGRRNSGTLRVLQYANFVRQ